MKKIIWMFFTFLLCISCASHQSYGKEKWTYAFFTSTQDSKEGVLKKWGEPTEKGFYKLGDENTEYFRYRDSEGRHYADFFIHPKNGKVVEKSYSPDNKSDEFHLKKLKKKHFPNITFEKIPVKCRHHEELILMNREKGLFIMTSEKKDAIVYTIAFSNKKRLEAGLKEMNKQKCRYR